MPKLKFLFFHSGSLPEFPNASQPETSREEASPECRLLSRDREEDVPECSGQEIFRIFLGNIRFSGNAIWERRPLSLPTNQMSHQATMPTKPFQFIIIYMCNNPKIHILFSSNLAFKAS